MGPTDRTVEYSANINLVTFTADFNGQAVASSPPNLLQDFGNTSVHDVYYK